MITEEVELEPVLSEEFDHVDEAVLLEQAVARLQTPIEALLFVASEPLSIKQIAKLVRSEEREVAATLARLEETYVDRGIVLRQVAGGFRFASSPLARDVVEAYLLPPKSTLSTPALETLAIVAYTQPSTRGEIEAIRGVNSDSVLSTLLERGLIAEAGRKDVVGRPMQYETTPAFLESFGLRSLDDLPQLELEAGQPLELDLLTAGIAAQMAAANAAADVPVDAHAEETAAGS